MIKSRILPFLCALLLALPASADFSFVHTSDTHVTDKPDRIDTNARMYQEISALQPTPAFVINTGDVVEVGTPEEYESFRQTLEHLTIPNYNAPGNHDVRWNPLGKEGYVLGTGQPLYRSWDYENVHFITLDSTVLLQHWGHISQDQLDWLKQDLERVGPDRPIVIGFHHWVGRDKVQVDNEQKLLELVAPYNVRLWVQGHGHSDIQWNVNGTPAIMQKGMYQGSYSVMEVTSEEIRIRRRSLGKPDPANELVRDKSVPQTPVIEWSDVMTVPLAKQAAPNWEAQATVEDAVITLVAQRGDLPADAKLAYRIDGGAYADMSAGGDRWTAGAATGSLVAGEHIVTVQATLSDGRAYQKPLHVTMTKPDAPTPLWTGNVSGAIQSRLVRADDSLYITTMGNDLVAIDPVSGKESWRVKAGGPIFSTPHVADGVVYFGSADHFVYAVDAKTHQMKWKTETGGAVFAGANVANGVVCIASVDKHIYGFDATDGQKLWEVKGDNMFQSKTATDGVRFFVGGWDSTFRAIDAKSGDVVWEKKLGKSTDGRVVFFYSPAISSPAVGDAKVYVTSNDGVLHAMNCETGDIVWEHNGLKLGYSSPLYHDGRVYCAIGDEGKVFCWNSADGKPIWEQSVGSVIYDSSFAESSGKVFIGCVDGTFNCLDSQDGKIIWQYRLGPGHLLASPATDDNRVYIGSLSGQVVALPVN